MKIEKLDQSVSNDLDTSNPETEASDWFDERELEYLNRSTPESQQSELFSSLDRSYSKEELQELYDDFAGYINDDVRYEYDGEKADGQALSDTYGEQYRLTGLHRISWGKDAVEGTEQEVVLPAGARIVQYAREGQAGHYFAPEGSLYAHLQLPESEDHRVLSVYEIQKDFPVIQSNVAKQYFTEGQSVERIQLQYRSSESADALEQSGILKKIGAD